MLTLSLATAGYVFAKLVEVGESEQHKKHALLAFNALWGCTIGHFVHGYLPQVRLNLMLPLMISGVALANLMVYKSKRR